MRLDCFPVECKSSTIGSHCDESEDRESCIGQRNGEGKIRGLPRSRFSWLPNALFYHLDCIMSCFNGLVKFLIYALEGHEKFPLVIIGQLNHS